MHHTFFMPHGWCMTWNPALIGLHVITDALVAISYYSIPAALFFIAWRKRISVAIQPLLILFGLFIALCGGGHVMDIVAIWKPIYWFKGFWNAGTAAASVLTALVLIPRTIDFLRMPETTERLQRETSLLREQQHLLQNVIDAVAEGIVLLDENGTARLRNRAAQILQDAGDNATDWPGHRPTDYDTWHSPYGRIIERFTQPIEGAGQLYVLRDITGPTRAEEIRIRLERIISTMKQGFSIIALDSGCIIQTNPSLARMHGVSEQALVSRPASDLYAGTPAEREQAFCAIQEECERNRFWDGQTHHARADGTYFFCSSRFNLHEEHGQRFLSSIHFDISDQKRIEEDAARVQARLLETAKLESLGVLAGGVAHDFNNLLTGILGSASLALDCLPQSSPAYPLLQNTLDATERAAKLTNQLLAYSGKGRFIVEPVRLATLARELTGLLQMSIPRNVRVVIEDDPQLPCVEVDVAQMEQLLMNLVLNAAEAIGEAVGTVRVTSGIRMLTREDARAAGIELNPGEYVWLEVADTGCGMDEATLKQIFDPFFTTKFTGRGLGLAAAQGIIRGHEGALSVRSEKGRGSAFTLYLPVTANPRSEISESAAHNATLDGHGTVLVIDDEPFVRAAAAGALHHYGYQVLEAADGLEGLRTFEAHADEISLVLLDLTMPTMNGEQTLHRLREKSAQVPVLLTSGYAESEATRRFASRKVSGYLQKPFTARLLGEKARAFAKTPQRVE